MSATKQIKFGAVEIREYPIILSNNPSCHYGPAVEIGWEYFDITAADGAIRVCQHEKKRFEKRGGDKPSRKSKFYLSQVKREALLKEAGYTEKDLKSAVRDKKIARVKRSLTKLLIRHIMFADKVEGTVTERKLKRAKRNLKKLQNNERGNSPFFDNDELYKGWWLPFSAYIL